MADTKLTALPELAETPADGDLLYVVDISVSNTSKKVQYSHVKTAGGPNLLVAASNAPTVIKNRADYTCTGTGDQATIQAAIDALPTNGGTVTLSEGTFSTTAEIYWAKNSVTLRGQGVDATKITATTAGFNVIRVGNRQSDSIMRNYNRIESLTASLAGGASSYAVIKLDGAGQGSQINNVVTNEGKYGFELMDLDRCSFNNIYANNPRTAGIFLEVGLENTYGTVTFMNPSVALSDNSTTCLLMGPSAGQASPNAIDRITVIGALWFSTSGLTGTKGIEVNIGLSSFVELGSLSESPITHVKLTGANSQICQMSFIECSFIQNSGVSTDIFQFNSLNHVVTAMDCRFQQATNVFNGVSGFSIVNLYGRNNNQGTITNIFTGTFGAKQGTDTIFGGDDTLAMGLNSNRFSYTFTNKIVGNPVKLIPSSNSTSAIRFLKADESTLVASIDTTNSRLVFAEAANIQLGTTTGTKIGTVGGSSGQKLAFFNSTPIVQPLLATGAGASVDNVITVLQNLGLVRQS